MSQERCVVTGLGMISSLGNNVEECWNAAKNGVSGIRQVQSVSTESCYSNLGAEVRMDSAALSGTDGEDYDRSVLLCIRAATEALSDAGYAAVPEPQTGVILGSCVGGADSIDRYFRGEYDTPEKRKTGILKMPASAIAGNVAAHFQLSGVTANIVNACAAGTMSIAYACDLIRLGKGEVFLAGGTDSFSSLAFSGFHALHALSENPCSPFNHSNGITLGEGAGVLVVERYEHAVKRGAKIYCEILGSGISADAYHITAPRPDAQGQMSAIRRAMESSGVTARDVDYINAHGTGTAKNDEAEFLSIRTLFAEAPQVSVSSTKSMTGHCLGAAGSIEAVLTIRALCEDTVPPTIGYNSDDLKLLAEKAGEIDFVANESRQKSMELAMSNSFAFGGNNASILFSKHPHEMSSFKAPESIYITGIGSLFADTGTPEKGLQKKLTAADVGQFGIRSSFFRKLDRFSQLQLISGMAALQDAAFSVTEENAEQIGSMIGTADGPASEITGFQKRVVEKGTAGGSAFAFPNTVYNAAGGYFSIASGIKGYSMTIAGGTQAGLQSICCAADALRCGKAQRMTASGTDENGDIFAELTQGLGVSGKQLADGSLFQMGEGSVTLLLETAASAVQRGAKPYAALAGYATVHQPVPYGSAKKLLPELLRKAVLDACESAGISPEQIDAVGAFGNDFQDVMQTEYPVYEALCQKPVPVYVVRQRTGEARAASAAEQVAYAAKLLSQSGMTVEMEQATASGVEKVSIQTESLQYILTAALGMDGSCTAVILKRV